MSKKPPRPEVIKAGSEWYKLVVLLIHTKDRDGRPKLATFVHDDEKIDLAGGEEFITAYVPKNMLEPE